MLQYVQITAKKAPSVAEDANGITEAQKNEFFKLYTQLSRKVKKFVGRKKNGKLIKSNFENCLKAMRELVDLG